MEVDIFDCDQGDSVQEVQGHLINIKIMFSFFTPSLLIITLFSPYSEIPVAIGLSLSLSHPLLVRLKHASVFRDRGI